MGDISDNFSRWEWACQDNCGFDTVDVELVDLLEVLRFDFGGRAVTIISGCRCEVHNIASDGSKDSQHTQARGADFTVRGVHPDMVADYLESKYPDRYGIGRYKGRTHCDTKTGVPRRWDER